MYDKGIPYSLRFERGAMFSGLTGRGSTVTRGLISAGGLNRRRPEEMSRIIASRTGERAAARAARGRLRRWLGK